MDSLKDGDRRFSAVAAVTLFTLASALGIAASLHMGGFDDAFITYTFSKNVSLGEGVVWALGGPPVYGSSSLTFMFLLAGLARLGANIPIASCLLGALGWATTTALLFLQVRAISNRAVAVASGLLCAVCLLPLNLAVGMESGLYTALVLVSFTLFRLGHLRWAFLTSALLVLTRLDGALVPLLIAAHAFLVRKESRSKVLISLLQQAAPAISLVVATWIVCDLYFGHWLPHSFLAKRLFDPQISGTFSIFGVARTLIESRIWPLPLVVVGAVFVLARLIRTSWTWRDPAGLPFLWAAGYLVMYQLSRLPDSLWYGAPVIPVLLAAGPMGAELFSRRWRWLPVAISVPFIGYSAVAAVNQIRADPFGRAWLERSDQRRLALRVVEDMTSQGRTRAKVLAFEVGFLGYLVPGEVVDLLGLVSPDVLSHGGAKNPVGTYERAHADYVVIIDLPNYPPTWPIQTLPGFHSDHETVETFLRREYPHNYVIYRRRQKPVQ